MNLDCHEPPQDLDVEDILQAMREQGSYLDVSPDDVLALYKVAYAHAARRLARDTAIREIMTARVAVVSPGDTALDAARMMASEHVSGLPVVSGGAVAGVVSLKDVLRLLRLGPDTSAAALAAHFLDPSACSLPGMEGVGSTPVERIMSAPARCVGPDATRSEAAGLMARHGVNRLPVVEEGRLCGIVTRGDVARPHHDHSGGRGA